MISVVRVARFLFAKASEAAFLSNVEPAMQPKIIGFCRLNNYNSGETSHQIIQGIQIEEGNNCKKIDDREENKGKPVA